MLVLSTISLPTSEIILPYPNLLREVRLPHRILFHTEGGDALEQVAQGGCRCPIPAGIQGQAGCGSGQPGLAVGDPAHSRGVETR